jgi:hypothetical protein
MLNAYGEVYVEENHVLKDNVRPSREQHAYSLMHHPLMIRCSRASP